MVYQTLNYQKVDKVVIINLQPSIDTQAKISRLSDELGELGDAIFWDNETRVVILTGVEAISFRPEEVTLPLPSIAESIAKLDKPVIASLNGEIIGQGLELALACDLRVATEVSSFGLPHLKVGLIPWDGGTQRLSRLVGRGNALEMILTGKILDVQEAYRIGLVNQIVPQGDLMPTVEKMAKEIASKSPIAIRYVKEAVYQGMDLTLEQGLHLEADLYLLLHTTQDRTEGIRAFREKKSPHFEGK